MQSALMRRNDDGRDIRVGSDQEVLALEVSAASQRSFVTATTVAVHQ